MTRERIELNGHDESYNPSLDRGRARPWSNGHSAARISAPGREDTSETFDFESQDEAQFLRTEKRVPVRRGTLAKKTASRLKTTTILGLAVALLGCVAVAASTYGIHAARFRIESSDSIKISGVHNASRVQVMEVAGSDIGRNIFFVPLDERRKQLEQIPWVESASVMRLWPNRIAVSIAERTPVAFVLLGSRSSLIDANGVIMGPPAGRQNAYRFPVIRGMTESEALSSRAAAMKIYNRLMHELDSGDDEGEHFTRQLSEIDLSDAEDVKATVSNDAGTVLIHLGSSDFLERYKLYAAHIGEWRRQYHNVQSVDLRYEGQIIVNPDGEHFPQPQPQPPGAVKPPVQPKLASHPAHASTRHKRQKKGSRK